MNQTFPTVNTDTKAVDASELETILFESSLDCVKLLDAEGRILSMNQNGRCVMEISDFDRIAHRPWSVLWPEQSHDTIRAVMAAARSGAAGHFSAFCPTMKGTPKWWEVTVTPVPAVDGRQARVLAVSRDVTAAYRANEEMRESRALFSLLVELSGEGIYGMGPDNRCTFMNRTGAAMLGYEPGELVGRHLYPLLYRDQSSAIVDPAADCRLVRAVASGVMVHIDDDVFWRKDGMPIAVSYSVAPIVRDGVHAGVVVIFSDITQRRELEKALDDLAEGGAGITLDKQYLRKDGSLLWATSRVDALRSRSGQYQGLVATVVAASQRKEVEEVLYRNERQLRSVLDSIPQKIFTATATGDVDYLNPAWMAFTGATFEAMCDWRWTKFVHPDDLEENVRLWKQAVERGQSFELTHRFQDSNGEYRWHLSRALPLRDENGRITMWIGSNTDIQDVKFAEEQLALRLQTEQRNTALLERVATVSRAIHAASSVEDIARLLTEETRNILRTHQSVVSLRASEDCSQAINAISLSDKYGTYRSFNAVPDGTGIYAEVCRTNKPMRLTQQELESHPAWKGFGSHASEHPAIRGWLAVPLVGQGGRNFGLIQTSDKFEGEFTEQDEAVLTQLASIAAVRFENARLVDSLRANETHLSAIFEQTAAGIVEFDADRRILIANNRYCQIVGRTRENVIGESLHRIIHPDDSQENFRLLDELLRTGEPFELQNRYALPDGSARWVNKTVSMIRASDGKSRDSVLAVVLDITERKHAEQALREQTEKLRLATEAAQLGMFDHDIVAEKINWNTTAREQFGVAPEVEVTRDVIFGRIHPEDRDRMKVLINRLWTDSGDGRYRAEYRVLTADGRDRWIAASGQVFYDPPGRPVRLVGATMDVTERKEHDRKLQQASQHDSLTGLPNRALLYEYCSHILAMSARHGDAGALLFVDLDRFKPINDMYGHDVGDKVLQQVALRLQRCSRKEDIVSRLGGDEFIVVLPRIASRHDAAIIADHMLSAVGQPIQINDLQVQVSPSIGISLFPDHARDLELLIRCADMAMYAAKRDGRNNYKIYSARLSDHASGLLRLEILLKHALETDRLALYYQPILDVQSRELIGAEALIRIPAEDGILLGPTDFIPVAETAGLMNRMGEWVLREACRQHRSWRDMGLPPVTIAVNVSPTQFRQANFVSILEKTFREFDIDPGYLQLEVTESTVMHDVPETIDTLNRLQAMGVKIALDDFGTGYSSLSHLSNLPLDKLKIDQSFIKKMTSSQSSRSITEAIIGLGQTLNLKVVGEGVESEASMELLRRYGCNQAQGFLFSKPLPAHEFVAWYRSSTVR